MIPFENGSTARAEDYAEGTIVELEVPWNSEPEQYEVDSDTFAVIFTPEGEPVDLAHNMDTSRSMVNEGYFALVVKPTEQFSIEELQRSLDLEAVSCADCFDKSWKNHEVV